MANIYALLASQGNKARQRQQATDTGLQHAMLKERIEAAEAAEEESSGIGLGGLLGSLAGALGVALAPVTGGMSTAMTAAATGAGAGVGSYAGREIGKAATPNVSPGRFNVQKDKELRDEIEGDFVTKSLGDALKAGLLSYAWGTSGLTDKLSGFGSEADKLASQAAGSPTNKLAGQMSLMDLLGDSNLMY